MTIPTFKESLMDFGSGFFWTFYHISLFMFNLMKKIAMWSYQAISNYMKKMDKLDKKSNPKNKK